MKLVKYLFAILICYTGIGYANTDSVVGDFFTPPEVIGAQYDFGYDATHLYKYDNYDILSEIGKHQEIEEKIFKVKIEISKYLLDKYKKKTKKALESYQQEFGGEKVWKENAQKVGANNNIVTENIAPKKAWAGNVDAGSMIKTLPGKKSSGKKNGNGNGSGGKKFTRAEMEKRKKEIRKKMRAVKKNGKRHKKKEALVQSIEVAKTHRPINAEDSNELVLDIDRVQYGLLVVILKQGGRVKPTIDRFLDSNAKILPFGGLMSAEVQKIFDEVVDRLHKKIPDENVELKKKHSVHKDDRYLSRKQLECLLRTLKCFDKKVTARVKNQGFRDGKSYFRKHGLVELKLKPVKSSGIKKQIGSCLHEIIPAAHRVHYIFNLKENSMKKDQFNCNNQGEFELCWNMFTTGSPGIYIAIMYTSNLFSADVYMYAHFLTDSGLPARVGTDKDTGETIIQIAINLNKYEIYEIKENFDKAAKAIEKCFKK